MTVSFFCPIQEMDKNKYSTVKTFFISLFYKPDTAGKQVQNMVSSGKQNLAGQIRSLRKQYLLPFFGPAFLLIRDEPSGNQQQYLRNDNQNNLLFVQGW